VDLNNLPDDDPFGGGQIMQEVAQRGDNPINMDQGFMGLLANSLLPWNHLPNNNNQG